MSEDNNLRVCVSVGGGGSETATGAESGLALARQSARSGVPYLLLLWSVVTSERLEWSVVQVQVAT